MASNQKKYNTYRLTFGEMVYESYSYSVDAEGLKLEFSFRLNDKIVFRPTAAIPRRPFLDFSQPKELMDTLVFNIGMIELVSYWKCVCPPVVRVLPHSLDDEQIRFWKKIYFNGLGEFFYTNGINASQDDFMTIVSNPQSAVSWQATQALKPSSTQAITNYLVPIGGGKDSVVTLEALRPRGVRPLIMNPRGATTLCAERGGFSPEETLVINRRIDPLLLDLNAKGCLNGHTPFSAMLAFYTLLAATLSGVRNVALSNENSANESTVAGSSVNHQYSKSLEFENDFRRYVSRYVTPDVNYFSYLRPLGELQIAKLFSQEKKYFDVFKSCNAGSKQDIWCGRCAKCLFAYIILSPFIEPETLNSIFGKSMLDDCELRGFFEELTGHTESKPFECVGTISEVNTALMMAKQRWYTDGNAPKLLKAFEYSGEMVSLKTLFPDHNLSPEELEILKTKLAD
ncbi:MAG: hypothetical protein II975_07295 [Bacteroidales bacterium]|nr:hypothetical protein [Bacteroidales bacterium]MBQ6741769.1 hypothetical protein [Bacteroidales bacterium]